MEKTIRILEFDDIKEKLVSLIKNYSLIPVIGAGFSCGSKTANGIVPNGTSMKNHMIETLKIEEGITGLKDKKFSKVATYYNRMIDAKLRKKYISDNFIGVRLNAAQKAFLNIKWPYLYSLNIDDAIEFNSNFRPIGPNKQFENNFLDYGNVVFKLHGDAKDIVYLKDGEDFSIFDTQQYIKSLEKNKWILDQLKQDYLDKNILFIGCSLSDEIDLLHVFSDASNVVSHNITERYFLTDKMLNQMDLIDLENYGITVVVHVNSYDDFYNSFYQIKKEAELIEPQSLDFYKNIEIASLDIKSKKNQDYLLYEKTPFDIEKRKITLPYYFIERKTSTTIIDNLQTFPLHIVYGRRISGKSYMLLDIYNKVRDRDKFYFDSRAKLGQQNLEYLFNLKNVLVLVDTNVLDQKSFKFLLSYPLKKLKDNNINIIVCANVTKRDLALDLHNANGNDFINIYYLENKLLSSSINNEYEQMKVKLASINLPYFAKNKTILDNIVEIQNNLISRKHIILSDFSVEPDNYLHIAYLILLANYGKLTSSDMIKFGLTSEPYELMPKLDKAVEPDYRKMITSSTFDSSSYQIVCNAQIWLLSYFSHISLQACYFDSIVNAVIYIVNQINSYHNIKELNRQELFDFIKFDNINTILGGARANNRPSGAKKLIQRIYSELKPVLGNDYQFNHQHAKCLLWCIEELNESERQIDLKVALQSILLSIRQIEDAIENTPKNRNLKISFAHAQFTLAIIKVKQFFFNKNKETFSNAVLQTFKALQYEENLNAYELTDEATDDENDYSISKFMDYLMEEESSIYRDRYAQQINWIINFRFRHVRNKNQNT